MPSNATIDRNGKPSLLMIPAKEYEHPSLAYIDLDLPKDDDVFNPPTGSSSRAAAIKAQQDESSTIYKTVDFEMTKAFNQIRKDVKEEKRQVVTRDHRIWQDPQGVLDKTLVSSRVS